MASYSSNYLRLLSQTKRLASHVNHGRHKEALSIFHHIHSSLCLSLDPHVFPLALKSCSHLHCPYMGTSIHSLAQKLSFTSNPFVGCALVDMYGKCVSISSARQLFDEIPERNAVVWNSMISLYAHSTNVSKALELFESMEVFPSVSIFNSIMVGLLETSDGFFKAIDFYRRMLEMSLEPNLITVLALLRACSGVAALNLIKEIHAFSMRNCISINPQVGSGLVEAYGKCGSLNSAFLVFQGMSERDVVAWSSLISAYALQGEAKTALEAFSCMERANVKPDGITFLAVLKACSHGGLADEAWMYFTHMQNFYGVDADSDHYACLVDVLSRAGRLYEAYNVIKEMPVKVTAKAWGALLGACRMYGELELGEVAGKALFEIEPQNPANYILLAKLYASSGLPEEAQRITIEMKERGVKVAPGSSWTVEQS